MKITEFFNRQAKVAEVKPKVALCLGGGGARGFAHIGAIKLFEEEGLDFDICVGTSIGSVVGAFYCANTSSAEMINYCVDYDVKEVHSGFLLVPNDAGKIGRIVTNLLGDASIEDLPKKFAAVAVDLRAGRQVILDKGKLGIACSASSAIPMFYRPVVYNNMHLADGGLLNNIPADVCKMFGADKVVSIDVNPTRGSGSSELGMIDVLKTSFSIMMANSSFPGIRNSDVIISVDTSKYKTFSKDGYQEMIEAGYEAAKLQLPKIKELFSGGLIKE